MVLASIVTLVALPAIWLANRSDDAPTARPNVAAVGLDPGQADAAAVNVAIEDPLGTSGAAHLQPLSSDIPERSVEIAVGAADGELVGTARGTFRRSIYAGQCLYNGLPGGTEVTVVNVANQRSTSCTTDRSATIDEGILYLSQAGFQQIAELVAAPIHVEIRQE